MSIDLTWPEFQNIPVHGQGACEKQGVNSWRTCNWTPEMGRFTHNTDPGPGACANRYFMTPNLFINFTVHDACWIGNEPNITTKIIVSNAYFNPKPICFCGGTTYCGHPNERHPFWMKIILSLIIKPSPSSMIFDNSIQMQGKNPKTILHKTSVGINTDPGQHWSQENREGWIGSDNRVHNSGQLRPNTILIEEKFKATHLRVQFSSNCDGCKLNGMVGVEDDVWHIPLLPDEFEFIKLPGPGTDIELIADPPPGGNPTFEHTYDPVIPENPPMDNPAGAPGGQATYFLEEANDDIWIENFKDGTNAGWEFKGWEGNAGPQTGSINPPNRFILKDWASITAKYAQIIPFCNCNNTPCYCGQVPPIKEGGNGFFDCNIDTVWPMTYDAAPCNAIGIGHVSHPPYPNQPLKTYSCAHSKTITGTGADGKPTSTTITWTETHFESPPRVTLDSIYPWTNHIGVNPPGHTSASGLCTATTSGFMPRAGYIFHGWQNAKLNGSIVPPGLSVVVGSGGGCAGPDGGNNPHTLMDPPPTVAWARWERVVNVFVNRGPPNVLAPTGPWHLHSVTRINSGGWQRNVQALKRNNGSWVDPFGRWRNF